MYGKSLLNRFQKVCLFLSMGCFIILATMVFVNGVFCWSAGSELYNEMNVAKRGVLIFIAVLCVILTFGLVKKFYEKFLQKINSRYVYMLMGITLIVLQVIFLLCSRNLLRYDALNVYDEAVSIFYDGEITAATKEGYFTRYVNNLPVTVITFVFLKIGRILHLVAADFHNGMLFLQFINLIAIDTALLFGFLFVRDFFKKKSLCFCYMVFTIISPLTYVWIPFYYTNTLSMPFYMAGLWLLSRSFFKSPENPDKTFIAGKDRIFCLLAGFLLYIGIAIRATVGITAIALGIAVVLFKKFRKRDFMNLLVCFLGVAMGICMLKPVIHKYVNYDYSDSAFTPIHWVMMGAGGEGTFNKADEEFTTYFEKAQDKKNADRIMLNQRINEMGALGTVKHAFEKMCLTFSDGTGNYPLELSISQNYDGLYRYIYGDRNKGILIYTQVMYLAALLCSVITAVRLFRRKEFHPVIIVLLNLLGGFLFYMIWEAGAVYSISFLPLFYVALAGGIDSDSEADHQKNSFCKAAIFIPILLLVIIGEGVIWGRKDEDHEDLVYRVNQFIFQTDHYQACSDNMILQQTFKSSGIFDEIAIQARNPLGELNDSIYTIELKNDKGEVCDSFRINSSEIIDYEFVRLSLDHPMEKGDYALTISKQSGNADIIWLYYDTGNYDAYTDGELTGFPVDSTMDLTFKVYYGKEAENYFDWYKEVLADKNVQKVDLILFMGQSNMSGAGGNAEEAPKLIEGAGYEFRAITDPNRLYVLQEPFGENENKEGGLDDSLILQRAGTLVTSFVNEYYKKVGIPVVGVSACRGSTPIELWVGEGLKEDAVERLGSAREYLNGNGYEIEHTYMVWYQGEGDGIKGTPHEEYKEGFKTFFSYMQSYGVEKCFLIQIGYNYNDIEQNQQTYLARYDNIRQAQLELCEELEDVILVSTLPAELKEYDDRCIDGIHFNQKSLNRIGEDAGINTALYVLDNMAYD